VNKGSQPSNTSTPHSGLITLEALRAAASATGMSKERRHLRVTIVSADPVQAKASKGDGDSKRK
jgi:hypothetical protein